MESLPSLHNCLELTFGGNKGAQKVQIHTLMTLNAKLWHQQRFY